MNRQPKSNQRRDQRNLFTAIAEARRVILGGAGNIGSHLVMELPLIGVKQILIIDGDRVDNRNLICCPLFQPADVGRPKADVLSRRIRERYSKIEVVPLANEINSVSLSVLSDWAPAVLVGAVDSRLARFELARIAVLLRLPLIDLAIATRAHDFVARAQVSWRVINGIDPLNAWSLRDWNLIEQKQSCGKAALHDDKRPIASSISGMLAAAIGLTEIRKLLSGDRESLGTEIRVDLKTYTIRRCVLPASGLSPLAGKRPITKPPKRCKVRTLGALVCEAEKLAGADASVVLRRDISTRFYCPQCQHVDYVPGPAEEKSCAVCGERIVALEPISTLCRMTFGPQDRIAVGCLGAKRDILRVMANNGSEDFWLEYEEENQYEPAEESSHIGRP